MIAVPAYLDFPVFSPSGDNVEPDNTTYDNGFQPGDLFPCEFENWLMNRTTSNSLTSGNSVIAITQEILSVLTDQSISPDSSVHNQLLTAINDIVATPSRQGTGTPGTDTFLRGDGSWSHALTGALSVGSTLSATGNFSVNTNKFTVDASTGNSVIAGTLSITSDFSVNTGKFTVDHTTGNTVVAGILSPNGVININENNNYQWASSTTQGSVFTGLSGIFGSFTVRKQYAARGYINGVGTIVFIDWINSTTFFIQAITTTGSISGLTVTSGSSSTMGATGIMYLW